jgi:hypothetical protein
VLDGWCFHIPMVVPNLSITDAIVSALLLSAPAGLSAVRATRIVPPGTVRSM